MSRYTLYPLEDIEGLYEFTSSAGTRTMFQLTNEDGHELILKNEDFSSILYDVYGDRCLVAPSGSTPGYLINLFVRFWKSFVSGEIDNIRRKYNALKEVYEPLENYNSTEIHSGTDTTTYSGSEKMVHDGDNTLSYEGSEEILHSGLNKNGQQGNIHHRKIGKERDSNEVVGYDSSTERPNGSSELSFKSDDNGVEYKSVIVVDASQGSGGSIEFSADTTEQRGRTDIDKYNTINSQLFNEKNKTSYSNRKDKTTFNSNDEKQFIGRNDELEYGHTIKKSGNIGVTTSQQMLQSELDLRNYNLIQDVMKRFVDFCTIYA